MAEVNWDEAPEGTTHALWVEHQGWRWRKITAGQVHLWRDATERWEEFGYEEHDWLRDYGPEIATRPAAIAGVHKQPKLPVVVINGVEVDWGKAPEGTTHAATDLAAIRIYGQWRKLEDNTVSDWKGGEWVERVGVKPDRWKHANRGLFVEKPGLVAAAPVAKKEQLIVKKPVGWWS